MRFAVVLMRHRGRPLDRYEIANRSGLPNRTYRSLMGNPRKCATSVGRKSSYNRSMVKVIIAPRDEGQSSGRVR